MVMLLRDITIRLEFARFLKFAVVGIVGVVVNTVALYLLTTFVFGERLYLAAAAISLELSILNNFYLNEYWTFRDKTAAGGVSQRLVKFHGSRLLGAATTLLVLYFLTDLLHIYYLLSNLVGVGAGTLVNYLTSRFWVWG
jgi:dolichol-phosphate mannosyltransferase